MFVLWFGMGAEKGAVAIQGMLLNMAVAGAMLSYLLQAVSFIVLRLRRPGLARPYRSPLGIAGASSRWSSPLVTLAFQLLDPVFATGVLWVGVWFTLGIIWFALVGQNRLVLAPEEAFAIGRVRGRLTRRPWPRGRAPRANARPACGSARGRARAAARP